MPVAFGVNTTLYGNVVSVPIETPLAKNWTLATVPSGSVAAPLIVIGAPTKSCALAIGVVTFAVGALGLTAVMVTLILFETAWLPNESVVSALSANVPVAEGV